MYFQHVRGEPDTNNTGPIIEMQIRIRNQAVQIEELKNTLRQTRQWYMVFFVLMGLFGVFVFVLFDNCP